MNIETKCLIVVIIVVAIIIIENIFFPDVGMPLFAENSGGLNCTLGVIV